MRIQSKGLTVEIDAAKGAFDVIQRKRGVKWAMDRTDCRDLVVRRFNKEEIVLSLAKARSRTATLLENGTAARLEYGNFAGVDSSLSVVVLLAVSGEALTVEIGVNDADPNYTFESLYYPRSFLLPDRKDAYWLFPVEGGELIPASYRVDSDGRLGYKPTLKCHGAVQGKAGFLCLWDTPWDVYLGPTNSRRTGPKLVTRLLSSLGRFGYTRRFRFEFRESTDYADLIRGIYRPWAARRGYLRTLAQKAKENPKVRDMAGGAIFHQLISYIDRRKHSRDFVTFDHAAAMIRRWVKATGIRKGGYHLDGWCRLGYDALHPDVFPPLPEAGGEEGMIKLSQAVRRLGLHFGLHDNYLLFFPDAERYRDTHAVWGPDLAPHRDQFRAGGLNMVVSPPAARDFLIANYLAGQHVFRRRWTPAGKTYSLDFCYLDQFMISGGGVEEDFNPAHPLTREQFILGLMEIIRIMREKVGCITTSEHMYDFCVPLYDVNGNNSGVAIRPPSTGQVPAPLWNLAFHECLVPTTSLESAGGTAQMPAETALLGLIGGLHHYRPGYCRTDEALATQVAYAKILEPVRKLQEEVMFRECTGSRLLTADGSRQEADYEGITVFADLAKGHLDISGSRKADGRFDFSKCAYDRTVQDW